MGSEVLGPGADAPGSAHVAAPAAYAWAIAAADAAVRVPAANAEAAAWTVRGWADVAVGCLALDGPASAGSGGPAPSAPGAFGGLDEVVRATPVRSGGQHAARLRRLRKLAGPGRRGAVQRKAADGHVGPAPDRPCVRLRVRGGHPERRVRRGDRPRIRDRRRDMRRPRDMRPRAEHLTTHPAWTWLRSLRGRFR